MFCNSGCNSSGCMRDGEHRQQCYSYCNSNKLLHKKVTEYICTILFFNTCVDYVHARKIQTDITTREWCNYRVAQGACGSLKKFQVSLSGAEAASRSKVKYDWNLLQTTLIILLKLIKFRRIRNLIYMCFQEVNQTHQKV